MFIPSFSSRISTVPLDAVLSLTGLRNPQTEAPAYILPLQTLTKMKDRPLGEESLSGIPPHLSLLFGGQSVPLSAEQVSSLFLSSALRYSRFC